MDKVLEAQIERMRQLSEELTRARKDVTATNHAIATSRRAKTLSPLQDVRDYRTFETHVYTTKPSPASKRPRAAVVDPARKRHRG